MYNGLSQALCVKPEGRIHSYTKSLQCAPSCLCLIILQRDYKYIAVDPVVQEDSMSTQVSQG